jgi:CBS domain-containing protein
MRVSEVMIRAVTKVRTDDSVDDARDRMEASDIRSLVVVDVEGRLAGMLWERDLLRTRGYRPPPPVVSEIMAKNVHTIGPDEPAADAAQAMIDFKIDAVPVVDNGKLVGIVTVADFLSAICRLLRQTA